MFLITMFASDLPPSASVEKDLYDFFSARHKSGGGAIDDVYLFDDKAVISFATNNSASTLALWL